IQVRGSKGMGTRIALLAAGNLHPAASPGSSGTGIRGSGSWGLRAAVVPDAVADAAAPSSPPPEDEAARRHAGPPRDQHLRDVGDLVHRRAADLTNGLRASFTEVPGLAARAEAELLELYQDEPREVVVEDRQEGIFLPPDLQCTESPTAERVRPE